MTILQMCMILKVIMMLNLTSQKTTRHNIAKNIKSISRSTVYRRVNRMVELELLHRSDIEFGEFIIIATRGYELDSSYREVSS